MDIGSMQQAKAAGRTGQIAQYLHLRDHVVAFLQESRALCKQAKKSCGAIQGNEAAGRRGCDFGEQDRPWPEARPDLSGIDRTYVHQALAVGRRLRLAREFGKIVEECGCAMKRTPKCQCFDSGPAAPQENRVVGKVLPAGTSQCACKSSFAGT